MTERPGNQRRELEFEGSASAAEVADVLTRIADGIRARALSVSLGEEEVRMYPDGDLALEIEAVEKKSKAKIEITVSWRHRTPDAAADGHSGTPA